MIQHIHLFRDLDDEVKFESDKIAVGYRYICTTCGRPLKIASGVKKEAK